MRVFLTGATGFIGSHLVPQLLDHGHRVLGLTRSDAGVRRLEAAGVEPHLGNLDQPETLAIGAAAADAVIHCAFDHDFSKFVENTRKDERNIAAMGNALEGTDKETFPKPTEIGGYAGVPQAPAAPPPGTLPPGPQVPAVPSETVIQPTIEVAPGITIPIGPPTTVPIGPPPGVPVVPGGPGVPVPPPPP